MAADPTPAVRIGEPSVVIAECLDFSIFARVLRNRHADSLLQAIISLHWPSTPFLGNLEATVPALGGM